MLTTVENSSEYQRTISEHLGNINEMDIETLHTSIRDSMEVARQEHCSRVNNKDEKLLTKTKHLMKQRREMLQKHPRNEIQLRQINRDISKSVRKDVRDYINK